MALQDLTPQLRTRLSRMERAVGWFVILAAGLLLFGFGYYIYNTAERKGWFKTKAPYFAFTDRATGLKVGDPVKLMGLDVGQITKMEPMAPENFQYNMYVEFELKDPYYGYIWTEGSRVKVTTADLLGKRVLEVTKGSGGYSSYVFNPLRQMTLNEAQNLPDPEYWQLAEEIHEGTNLVLRALSPLIRTNVSQLARMSIQKFLVLDAHEKKKSKSITAVWNDRAGAYESFAKTNLYWLLSDESAAVTERLEKLVGEVETALPNILDLTNRLSAVLSNSASLTSNLNAVALGALPALSNITAATLQLDHPGALGEWLLPTNINRQLEATLTNARTTLESAHATFASADTNLTALAQNLERSLDNLANLTSNLNSQVQANTNLVSAIDRTIVHVDELVQGLKRHWLLRSAFKTKSTNAPPTPPLRSPKGKR